MSDSPPPGLAENAAGADGSALTPEAIAAVLDDFRAWLTAAVASGEATQPPPAPIVDLHTLVGQFTALRQEVNLQTRAVRAQQEQNAETLRELAEALEAAREAPAAAPTWREASADEGVRPLLKTLVDLYNAAALAGRELRRVQESTAAALRSVEEAAAEPEAMDKGDLELHQPAPAAPSWWARWFGGRAEDPRMAAWKAEWAVRRRREHEARRERMRAVTEAAGRAGQTLTATAAGFAMTLQRVERAMAQHGLEPIATVGRPFDPELMEVLEVVLDSGRPSGEVVEEVRRGYLWQGRVFRYAQVRVAKERGQGSGVRGQE